MSKDAGAKLDCKPCGKTFQNAAAKGSHMRIVHGVVGTSAGALAAQKTKKSKPLVLVTPKELPKEYEKLGTLDERKCPECEIMCKGKAALGWHRRAAHGIVSDKMARMESRKKREPKTELAIPEVKPLEEKQIDKRTIEGQNNTLNQIDPLLFAFTVGQIKEQCRHIAEEHDVPTKLFTRQFAELFYREARR